MRRGPRTLLQSVDQARVLTRQCNLNASGARDSQNFSIEPGAVDGLCVRAEGLSALREDMGRLCPGQSAGAPTFTLLVPGKDKGGATMPGVARSQIARRRLNDASAGATQDAAAFLLVAVLLASLSRSLASFATQVPTLSAVRASETALRPPASSQQQLRASHATRRRSFLLRAPTPCSSRLRAKWRQTPCQDPRDRALLGRARASHSTWPTWPPPPLRVRGHASRGQNAKTSPNARRRLLRRAPRRRTDPCRIRHGATRLRAP